MYTNLVIYKHDKPPSMLYAMNLLKSFNDILKFAQINIYII